MTDARQAYHEGRRPKATDDVARQVAIERRRERARLEAFTITPEREDQVLGYFSVVGTSGVPYTVEIRDPDRPINRCACPDYEQNTLGTCKHIETVLLHLRRRHPRRLKQARTALVERRRLAVHVGLGFEQGGWVLAPDYDANLDLGVLRLVHFYLTPYLHDLDKDPAAFAFRLKEFEEQVTDYGGIVTIAPEVWEHLAHVGHRQERERERAVLVAEVKDGAVSLAHLLQAPLYPFQLLGVLFLAFTERALLADDMGLGKTVQALGAAHLLREQRDVKRVLIICPASVKRQWAREIARFSGLSATVIGGTKAKRTKQYAEESFFLIINYELVLRDYETIVALAPDLIILDEAQRIKNWQAQTTRRIKELPAPYAFVLTGTPLENRLEELYSVVQFLDPALLGPAWQFIADHVVQDEWGAVTGYKDLEGVRHAIAPIFLRRRKTEVLRDLPPRIDNYYWVDLTADQARLYRQMEKELLDLLTRRNWTYEDRKQVLAKVTYLRELADAAQLVSPDVVASSKLNELINLVPDLLAEGHKLLIFSQWERMTHLAADALALRGIPSVRLHGGVGQQARAELVRRFMEEPDTRIFLSTDAGGVGLNLQAASYVINLDLPWNPARLEQRIARAHRMGQEQTVNVINLVASDTIENRVLDVLYAKQALFTELFDTDIDTINLDAAGRVEDFRALVAQLLEHA